jgi:hypothetical protein
MWYVSVRPILVAVLSMCRSAAALVAEIAGSNHAYDLDFLLLCLLFAVQVATSAMG